MNQTSLFDNSGQYVQKIHAERVICHLRDLTPKKTQAAVSIGFFGATDHARISLMKSGKIRIARIHLENFASHHGIDIEHLITGIMPEEENTPTVAKIAPMVIDGDPLIIAESERERFLCALQRTLGVHDGILFRAKLCAKYPQALAHFSTTGIVPLTWIVLVPEHDERKRLCADFVLPPQHTNKMQSHESRISQTIPHCNKLSDVPRDFIDAFFPACYAAGKARHLDCALQVFVGTLATQLPQCSITSKTVDDFGRKVTIYIQNGKTAMEFHFDPVEMFS
jgi:hypothetical protein